MVFKTVSLLLLLPLVFGRGSDQCAKKGELFPFGPQWLTAWSVLICLFGFTCQSRTLVYSWFTGLVQVVSSNSTNPRPYSSLFFPNINILIHQHPTNTVTSFPGRFPGARKIAWDLDASSKREKGDVTFQNFLASEWSRTPAERQDGKTGQQIGQCIEEIQPDSAHRNWVEPKTGENQRQVSSGHWGIDAVHKEDFVCPGWDPTQRYSRNNDVWVCSTS